MSNRDADLACASIQRLTGQQYPNLEAVFQTLEPDAVGDLLRLTADVEKAMEQAKRDGAWTFARKF